MNIYKTTPIDDMEYLKTHCQLKFSDYPSQKTENTYANYIRRLQKENPIYNAALKICQISAIGLGISFLLAVLFGGLWEFVYPDSTLISYIFCGSAFSFIGCFVLVILSAIVAAPLENRVKSYELEEKAAVYLLNTGNIAVVCAASIEEPRYQFLGPIIFDWRNTKTDSPKKLPFSEWEMIKRVHQYHENGQGNFIVIADAERYYLDFVGNMADEPDPEFCKRYFYKKQKLKRVRRILRCDEYSYVMQEALENLKK